LGTRKPELGTPQLALSLKTWSIVAHVMAGVLIVGTAISEIWLSLDAAGQYLFAIYGGAAAIAVLGIFAFYLSFVAELPPPPPKPIKAKKLKERRAGRRKKHDDAEDVQSPEETDDTEEVAEEPEDASETQDTAETEEAEVGEPEKTKEEPVAVDASAEDTEEPRGGLQNRRPTGKASHRLRRRSTRGTVTLDEPRPE